MTSHQKTISALTELTAAGSTDDVPIVDNSGQSSVTKRITVQNAFKSVPAGQAATPGLAFAGDVDTGISRVGADQLALCTGGQARLTVGATGDITIGSNLIVDGTTTTIRSETLLVEDKNIELGTVASPSNATADGGGITLKGATDKTIKWINSTGAWTFNQPVNITGGNVGIGTTQPGEILHVNGTASAIKIDSNGDAALRFATSGTNKFSIYHTSGGTLNFFDNTNSQNRLKIDSNGNVGVNTSSFPANGKNLKVSDGTISRLVLEKTGTGARAFEVGVGNSFLNVYDATADEERIRIDNNGNVGVGLNNPSYEFHVKGAGTVAYFEGTGGNGFIGIEDADDGSIGFIGVDGGNIKFQTSGASYADSFVVTSTGNAEFGGQIFADSPTGAMQISRTNADAHTIRTGISSSIHPFFVLARGSTNIHHLYDYRDDAALNVGYFTAANNVTRRTAAFLTAKGTWYLGNNGDTTTSNYKTKLGEDGSALFASNVSANNGITVDGGSTLSTGIYYRDDSNSYGLALYSGGSAQTNRKVFIKTDGSATFNGQVVCGNTSGNVGHGVVGLTTTAAQAAVLGRNTGSYGVTLEGRNSNNDTTFVVDSIGRTRIGPSPSTQAMLNTVAQANLELARWQHSTNGYGYMIFKGTDSSTYGYLGDGVSLVGSGTATDFAIRAENKLLLSIGNSEKARIDSSGRLLIGTNDGNLATPLLLGVTGTASATDNAGSASNAFLRIFDTGSNDNRSIGIDIRNRNSGDARIVNIDTATANTSHLAFLTDTDSGTGLTEKMRITNSGTVLIGGTSTADNDHAHIDASGTLTIRRTSATDDAIVVREGSTLSYIVDADGLVSNYNVGSSAFVAFDNEAGTSGPYAGFGASSGEARITAGSTASDSVPLVFRTASSGTEAEKMRLTHNGYLKASYDGSFISTVNNSHELHGSQPNYYTLHVRCDGASPLSHYIQELKFNDATPNNSSARFLQCRDATAIRMDILSNGGIANYQSNDSNLCDEREKKNIVSLDSKWDKVKSWELKKFHYNEEADTDALRYGVIAQQVETLCPEVLTNWIKQKAEDAVLDDDGNVVTPAQEEILRKGVKEQQMMWMAIKALQEAQARIETLEAKVAALES